MTASEAPEKISESVQQEEPGEKEVPAAPHGEVAVTGKRRPPRNAALLVSALGITAEPEQARGIEVPAEQRSNAVNLLVMRHWPHGEDRLVEIRFLAEIKRGVGVEDLQAAHQQDQQHERVDPMGDAHRPRMAIDDLTLFHRSCLLRFRRCCLACPTGER